MYWLVLVILAAPPPAEVDPAAMSVFRAVERGWANESVKEFSGHFPEKGKVQLDLEYRQGKFSKKQAIQVFKRYFEDDIDVVKFKMQKKIKGSEENPMAVYDYRYVDKKTDEERERDVTVTLEERDEGWVILKMVVFKVD